MAVRPTEDEFLRRRRLRQKRIRKRRRRIAVTFFLILLIAVGAILSLTVLFPIKKVIVSGTGIYTPEQVVAYSGIKAGDNIFTASAAAAEKKLKKSLPYIESVKFKRKLPGTLYINLTDAKEYICYKKDGSYYAASKSGYILNCTDKKPDGIPEITAAGITLKVGEPVRFSGESTGELIETVASLSEEYGLNLTALDLTDETNIIFDIDGRFTVEFGTGNYAENKFKHLNGMIANIDSSKSGKINLKMWTPSDTKGTFTESRTK